MVSLVDTHCHLNVGQFDADREGVLRRAGEAGVVSIVLPGLDLPSSEKICSLASQIPEIYTAVGVHPNDLDHVGDIEPTLYALHTLTTHEKVIAIGEISLDYHWMKTPKEVQHEWLLRQLKLASHVALPVILHNRDSTEDFTRLLIEWVSAGLTSEIQSRPGVEHSFSGNWDDAQRFLDLGFYIGFTGPLTFPKSVELRDIAAKAPADRILIETDAPYLAPVPHRGKRNEPAYVRYVAEKLAEIWHLELIAVADLTTQNAITLFGLDMAGSAA